MLVARPEQQLRGAEAARGQEHPVGAHLAAHSVSPGDAIELDAIAAVRGSRPRTTWSGRTSQPCCLGERQIGEIQPVLRPNFAPDVAVAQVDARALLLSLRVDERRGMPVIERIVEAVVPVRRERHRERRLGEPLAVTELARPLRG